MAQSKAVAAVTIPLHYRLLASYMQALGTHPLRTRMITAAVFQTIEENIAVRVVGRPLDPTRLGKLIVYGLAIGGPLSHVTTKALTSFMTATGLQGDVALLVRVAIQNGVILPILFAAFIGSLAAMDGVKFDDIITRLRVSLPRILPMYWKVVPVLQLVASKLLPPPLILPFMLLLGSYMNGTLKVMAKRQQIKAEQAAAAKKEKSS